MTFLDLFTKNDIVCAICDGDLDGVGSRIILEHYLRSKVKGLICFTTGSHFELETIVPEKYIEKANIILFADRTPNVKWYKELIKNKIVVIVDHHKSAYDELTANGIFENYFYDNDRCGAKLLYDLFTTDKNGKKIVRTNKTIKEFIDLVNTYDLWKNDTELWQKAKSLHNVLYGYVNWKRHYYIKDDPVQLSEENKVFIQTILERFKKFNGFTFTISERAIIQRAFVKEESAYKQARKSLKIRTDNQGDKYIYFEATSKLSLVANRIAKDYYNKVKYLVCFSTWNKDNTQISLRNVDPMYDCIVPAQKWGGGGHKNASGVEFGDKKLINDFRLGKFHLI